MDGKRDAVAVEVWESQAACFLSFSVAFLTDYQLSESEWHATPKAASRWSVVGGGACI